MDDVLPWRTSIFGRSAEYTRHLLTACAAGGGVLAATAPLTAAEAAGWYDLIAGHTGVRAVIAVERTTRAREDFIRLSDLAGPGEPAALPGLPAGFDIAERHYRLLHDPDGLPLPTGDAVRRRRSTLAAQGIHPAPPSLGLSVQVDGLLEITLLHAERAVTRLDLSS